MPLELGYFLWVLVTFRSGPSAVHAADAASPVGRWRGEDGTFAMFETEGKFSAKIVELSEPKTPDGKEKSDITVPIEGNVITRSSGLFFISGLTKKSATCCDNGTVYDPKSRKTYSCFVELQGPGRLAPGIHWRRGDWPKIHWTRVNQVSERAAALRYERGKSDMIMNREGKGRIC